MRVKELQCPHCGAPVTLSADSRVVCHYCATELVVEQPEQPSFQTRMRFVITLGEVGVSNAARIAAVIRASGCRVPCDAETLVHDRTPEIDMGEDGDAARQLQRALKDAGASAELTRRSETVSARRGRRR